MKSISQRIDEAIAQDYLAGGLADQYTVDKIAEKHGVPIEQIKLQLQKGIEIEFEHTKNRFIAREIAMDHLFECPDYYTRLRRLEKSCEAETSV